MQEFLIDNWYTILMTILSIILCVCMISISFKKNKKSLVASSPSTCKINNSNYITSVIIGASNTQNSNGNYCPDGNIALTGVAQGNFGQTTTYQQLCYPPSQNICDTDFVVVDVILNNMSDSSGNYLPIKDRCPKGYSICQTINTSNYNAGNTGLLPCSNKIGICMKTQLYSDIPKGGQYIDSNGIVFINSIGKVNMTMSGKEFCNINNYPGFDTDFSYYICAGTYYYLAKRYSIKN